MVYTDGIHLMAESVGELHTFAESIGLKACWYHRGARWPHYDLMSGKIEKNRAKVLSSALLHGAIKVTSREMLKIMKLNYRMPETEEEVEAWERKHKWEVNRPLSKKEIENQAEASKRICDKLFPQCEGAKCQIPNCQICKNQMY